MQVLCHPQKGKNNALVTSRAPESWASGKDSDRIVRAGSGILEGEG